MYVARGALCGCGAETIRRTQALALRVFGLNSSRSCAYPRSLQHLRRRSRRICNPPATDFCQATSNALRARFSIEESFMNSVSNTVEFLEPEVD